MHRYAWLLICTLLFVGVVAPPTMAQDAPTDDYYLQFPLPMPTDEQLEAVRACDAEALAAERYSADLTSDQLDDVFEERTACDLAALATAFGTRSSEDQPVAEGGKRAYAKAVRENPAIAYLLPLLIYYFGQVDLVAPPDFSEVELVEVEIYHSYSGLGGLNVEYNLQISVEDGSATVEGDLTTFEGGGDEETRDVSESLDAALVDALLPATANLIPSGVPFSQVVCFDNYPDWEVTLTFDDDTQMHFFTNGSNVLNAGGPWQAEIDGRYYMQHSAELLTAILAIQDALQLPFGETAAMSCGGLQNDPIDDAFPPEDTAP